MDKQKILIVEDEPEIAEIITLYLKKNGFQTIQAEDGVEALQLARELNPHLIILDIFLPKMDGMEVCQEIRKFANMPIIFLSCKNDEQDKIISLSIGGDDYMTKPFSPNELVARVKAHLRRNRILQQASVAEDPVICVDKLRIDTTKYTVHLNNEPINLSAKEFHLLVTLAKQPKHVFSLEKLYHQVWNSSPEGDVRTVMVHISNLRKKIEFDPSSPKFIHTVRGVGYKFSS